MNQSITDMLQFPSHSSACNWHTHLGWLVGRSWQRWASLFSDRSFLPVHFSLSWVSPVLLHFTVFFSSLVLLISASFSLFCLLAVDPFFNPGTIPPRAAIASSTIEGLWVCGKPSGWGKTTSRLLKQAPRYCGV